MADALRKNAEERMLLTQQRNSITNVNLSARKPNKPRSYETLEQPSPEKISTAKAAALANIDFRLLFLIVLFYY